MRKEQRVFGTVDDVIQAYFTRFLPDSTEEAQETEPRSAGETLARSVAESTRAKVQNALTRPNER